MKSLHGMESRAVTEAVRSALPLLDIRGVSIDYKTDKGVVRAVDKVSFAVASGDCCMLVGHSGCGKSTLLKAVGGFVPVTEGALLLNDHPISKPGLDRIVVWQDVENQLQPWLPIEKCVAYPLLLKGVSKAEARDRALAWIETVGLTRVLGHYPHELSGGQKQRVAIARGFATEPDILLMDEPFSALDALTRHKLQEEVRLLQAKSGTTILFVSHDTHEAATLGSSIVVLSPHPGRVKAILKGGSANLEQEIRELIFDGSQPEEGEEH